MKALEIEDLRKTYRGGFEALKGINLVVEEGDFYALLGPMVPASRPLLVLFLRWLIRRQAR